MQQPIVSMFGKIPAMGDFVSVGATSPIDQAFQDWLQRENDYLASKRRHMSTAPVRFIYRSDAGPGILVGALLTSRDQVGRSFPLAIYTSVDVHTALPKFSALPAAFTPFLDGAVELLLGSDTRELQGLVADLQGLHLPSASEVRDAQLWTREALEATPGQVILEALFGPLSGGMHYHGVNMFRTGCAQVRGRDPGKAPIILECPASDDVQLAFWLCMAEGLLGWTQAPPTLMWTDVGSSDSRLLLGLGGAPLGLLDFVADPAVVADRLWPIRTSSQASVEAGRKALSPNALQALDPPAPTAATLADALARA